MLIIQEIANLQIYLQIKKRDVRYSANLQNYLLLMSRNFKTQKLFEQINCIFADKGNWNIVNLVLSLLPQVDLIYFNKTDLEQ